MSSLLSLRYFSVAGYLAASVLLAVSRPAGAVTVQPMVVDLVTEGAGKSAQITVHNDEARDIAVQVNVSRIEVDENGTKTAAAAAGDFTIFPLQPIIPKHGAQSFRLQWTGGPIATSRTYIFLVEQLAVALPKTTNGMQIVFNVDVVATVSPPTGTRSLDLVSASAVVKGNKRLAGIVVGNTGTLNAELSDATVTLRGGSWSRTLLPAELRQLVGIGIVQPRKRRSFVLPIELPAGVNALTAEIAYSKAKS